VEEVLTFLYISKLDGVFAVSEALMLLASDREAAAMTSFHICCVAAAPLFKNGAKSRFMELMVKRRRLPHHHVSTWSTEQP